MSTWARETVEGPTLTIEDSLETDNACVIEGSRHLHILKHDRREAAQALAGSEYRVVPADRGRATFRLDARCPTCDEAAQPDRPEPVDPVSVRVGDYVEVVQQHDDIPLRITVEGEVYQLGRDGDSRHLFYIRGYGGPAIGDVTSVRILHAAEPEPDEAAVEALREAIKDCRDDELGDHFDEPRLALALAKRNVRVVSTDA